MFQIRHRRTLGALALLGAMGSLSARADDIKTVFVIAMENHNWTQPANQFTGSIQQVYQNPNAPFINNLVNGTAYAVINGELVNISKQTAYAAAYHNVLATPSGNNPHIHPSEPNYLWAEAGTNFGILNDNDPYSGTGLNNHNTPLHLSTLLTLSGQTWKSYQEDTDLTPDGNVFDNVPRQQDQWTVPLVSMSGKFASGVNAYNGAIQYSYAAKHNPMFSSPIPTGAITQLPRIRWPFNTHRCSSCLTDLANDKVADYNWISPNQYNDMHTSLTGGYKGLTGDAANIKQGDDFLSQIVPVIMASNAYKNHGVIILWWDEAEGDGVAGDNADDFNHTIGEIIISPHAHANVKGVPYASPLNFTHSSDLLTMQEIFRVGRPLGDAANAIDLSDLFAPGSIPKKP